MSAQESKRRNPSAAARAEAAAWVARLHGPNRTNEVEEGLRRWLADDPDHPLAFEQLTDTWERSTRLRRRPIEHVARWELVGFRLRFSRAVLATLAVAVLAISGTVYWMHSDVIATGIGELRTLTLEDGTRVHMNADTRLIVRYGKALRQVRLVSGEAFFEVTHDPQWPFVVSVNGRQIRDLGTEFDVLSERNLLSVTLVEGKVTVTRSAASEMPSLRGGRPAEGPARSSRAPPVARQPITLSPGERLTFDASQVPQIDRPSLDLVTAWERGQVVLDATPLADAVAQMNRYSRTRIILGPGMRSIRVSGVFELGDSASFAAALARTYHLSESTLSSGDIALSSGEPSGR